MKLLTSVLAAAWLMSGCASTAPNDGSPAADNSEARTGLCNDATPPPCHPPD